MYNINSLPILFKNPKILLIGGGKVAFDKAKVLIDNEIDFQIISINISEHFKSINITYILKEVNEDDLSGYNIIIDATGNPAVIKLIEEVKKKRFLLVNCVDVPEYCDFYFSSLLQYKNLKIAISSDGASPTMTQLIRNKIKSVIPKTMGSLAEQKLIDRVNGIIEVEKTKKEVLQLLGKVYLVGCGIGDPELLTIKAARIIREADVILYDNLISQEILDLIPEETEKIYVGKIKGAHHSDQNIINELLLEHAKKGLTVARLKSGDPYVFGRGAEEALFLIDNNIEVEVIPGISSSIAAPALAGIPVTARGYSSGYTVVTGCLKHGEINLDWLDLLKKKNHTVVLLMGLSYISDIVCSALKMGIDGEIPAAIISNASREDQEVIVTILSELPSAAINAKGPAVIVFGEVVRLSECLQRNKFEKQTL